MAGPVDEFWATFGDTSAFVEVTCGTGGSLAADVLSTYGIRCNSQIGGSLPHLDIKRMDALQVIKLSLLEASADDGQIYEPIMNPDGIVEFVAIGAETGLSGGDIYYEIQSGSYIESCGGVMVTGALPLARRREVAWKPIWSGGTKQVYDTSLLANDHCLMPDFSQQATIVFNDPHLDSQYEDGIDNLYEITSSNPYDHIMGYARYVEWPTVKEDVDAVVKKEDTARILLPLPLSFGTFIERPELESTDLNNLSCFESVELSPDAITAGVKIDIPLEFRYENIRGTKVDKLQSILDVYVIGLEIGDMRGIPPSKSESVNLTPEKGSAKRKVKITKTFEECYRLSKGSHYVIGYTNENEYKTPYVVFANNARKNDPIGFDGKSPSVYELSPESILKPKGTGNESYIGWLLPTGPTSGILVSSMFVSVLLETPSIVVYHPDGKNNKAMTIANSLTYWVTPLVSIEEPRPVAFNGTLLDMKQSIIDHDPTTAQNLEDTEFEKALDEMQGNGMALTLSFLEEDQCAKLSGALYEYLNSGDGTEATYVCGPDAQPVLGGAGPNGGIVNSISYSYQDSNSYTISVNCGPTLLGEMSQIEGGPSPMKSEDISAVGTIIQDMGNHINFKVRIDGYGERIAINVSPHVLRVGDKVACAIHNNPVES